MKKLLIVIPFHSVYPPINGGMLRCFHLLNQYAKYFKVTVVIFQSKNTFIQSLESYPDLLSCEIIEVPVNVTWNDAFNLLPRKIADSLRYRWLSRKWFSSANSTYLRLYRSLKHLLKNHQYDLIVFESLSLIDFYKQVAQFQANAKIIFDAHNIDSDLASLEFKKGLISKNQFESVVSLEESVSFKSDAILFCSEKDRKRYAELFDNQFLGKVIPNGVEILNTSFAIEKNYSKRLIFCGSMSYAPNREGLMWFFDHVWQMVKEQNEGIVIDIIGSGDAGSLFREYENDPQVNFHGEVPSVSDYYAKAAIAVVPLISGSGTRLKILEAMAMNVPVISTSKGAEGINCKDGLNIIIANNPQEFAKDITTILSDREYYDKIQTEARKLVLNEYDWNIVGKKAFEFLNAL